MPESAKTQGIGLYANLCLTVIAGCLIYLCNRSTSDANYRSTSDANPTRVEIVGIASSLKSPIPCKLMFKDESAYSTQWVDKGALSVRVVGGAKPLERMQVEIVDVASSIQNPLPITTKPPAGGLPLFARESSDDDAIPVRLVGIERPQGRGKWHAIPVRGPAMMSGESGGIIGSHPVEVQEAP